MVTADLGLYLANAGQHEFINDHLAQKKTHDVNAAFSAQHSILKGYFVK
jgi:hypothetical protein